MWVTKDKKTQKNLYGEALGQEHSQNKELRIRCQLSLGLHS